VLHGTPPFVLTYTTKHDKHPVKTLTKTVNSARSEITLKPEMSGSYTYTFTHISDKNYQKIPISGTPTTTQHVHPLASASFIRTTNEGRDVVSNCEGQSVEISMDLRVRLVGKRKRVHIYSSLPHREHHPSTWSYS
jgi:nucleoporin POM152